MFINKPIHKEIDIDWDLKYLAKHQTKYFPLEYKIVCEKFLKDNIITPELLKIYVIYQLEIWGDISKKIITFTCQNWTIKAKYNHNKSYHPVEIISLIQDSK